VPLGEAGQGKKRAVEVEEVGLMVTKLIQVSYFGILGHCGDFDQALVGGGKPKTEKEWTNISKK